MARWAITSLLLEKSGKQATGSLVGLPMKTPEKLPSILIFWEDGVTYKATLYKDAADAHYRNNPTAITIEDVAISKGSSMTIPMAEGGGFAISLMKLNEWHPKVM